jgi:hypothetical protein
MRDGRDTREKRDSDNVDTPAWVSRMSRLSRSSRDLQLTARTQTYISIDRFLTVMGFTGTA